MSIQEDMEPELHGEIGEVSPRVDSAPPYPSGPDRSEEFILGIITEIFTQADAFGADWRLKPSGKESEMWVSGQKNREGKGKPLPEQGWKLHVSANPLSAEEVLRRALPVLLAEDADFKVVASIGKLLQLNAGTYGLSQIGKFITVYPDDEDHGVRLAAALDEATRGLRGPGVPSDRPLARGSLVHYRYGGFARRSLHDPSGEALLAIRTPEGELVPDPRTPTYSPPDWAADPFAGAGVAAELPERSPLIGGRYLITTAIYGSARGTVYLGVDLAASRTCVLKHALRNGAMGIDGNDACDRLRNEAAVLARLAPDPRFPALYDLVEHDGELYLVMEEVEGDTLYEHVRGLAEQGRHVPPQQALTWVRELASMLGTIHARGIVYRDLKPSGVIVTPDGGLRLLDFDVCLEIGAPRAIYSPGTFGYISRQQRAHEPPEVTHDIYGLGAVLYFMTTGAEPSEYARPFDLLHRPLELLNPDIGPELSAVIERCLDPDPDKRFPSMEALEQWLSAGDQVRQRADPRSPIPDPRDYRELARQLGDGLCAAAQRRGAAGLTWPGPHSSEDHISSRNISTGSAGVLLALAELALELGEPRHREVLAEGAHSLAQAPPLEGPPLAGLYVGEAGIAVTLLRAGQVLADKELVEAALARGREVAELPYAMPALFSGTAGRLRAHLMLWDETGEAGQLAAAIEAGEALLRGAERVGEDMLRWIIPEGYKYHTGRTYAGYAIGASGIGDGLLDLYEATGDERFLAAAQDAGRWVISLAMPSLDDDSGLDWPMVEGERLKGAHWGHGAAGIGRFFLHASQLGAIPEASMFARRAARTTAQGACWSGSSQGYGLSGQIEFLLDMYQSKVQSPKSKVQRHPGPDFGLWTLDFGLERSELDDALRLARILETLAVEHGGALLWPATEDPEVFVPGYIVGHAGIAVCLLRLGDPERLPHHLSRRNFRKF